MADQIHQIFTEPQTCYKFLDKEAKGEGSDQGLLGGLWHFKDDYDETQEDAKKHDWDDASEQT